MNVSNTSVESGSSHWDSFSSNHENQIEEHVKKLFEHQFKHAASYIATEDVSKLVNTTEGAQLTIPQTKCKLKKVAKPSFVFEYFYKCEKCDCLFKHEKTSRRVYCSNCEEMISKYFVYIPLRSQIESEVHKHFDTIIAHSNRESTSTIRDVQDGKVFKKLQKKYCDSKILSLSFNTDGVQIFKSINSLWVILLYQNYLPPSIRYLTENILLVGLHYGPDKPNMPDFCYPLFKEMDDLQQTKIECIRQNTHHTFLPKISSVLCDLPARVMVTNFLSYNGKCCCIFCLDKGESIKNINNKRKMIRYVKSTQSELRKHNKTVATGRLVQNDPIDGIKGISCMIALKDLNMIDSTGIDWMHGTLLGAFLTFFNICMGHKKTCCRVEDKISTVKRKTLDKRILTIKPNRRIGLKPKSIFKLRAYKAKDQRTLLWYFLPVCLKGLISKRCFKLLLLLSVSTYILCKSEITESDLNNAGEMLVKFADGFEDVFGKSSVTMNVHLLRHYKNSVMNNGPLWSQSLFAAESMNGILAKYVKSPNGVMQQIADKYVIRKSYERKKVHETRVLLLSKKTRVLLQKNQIKALERSDLFEQKLPEDEKFAVSKILSFKNEIFTSLRYKKLSTIDYFVSVNNFIGMIEFFFEVNSKAFALINIYEVFKQNYHLQYVKTTRKFKVCDVNEIKEKLLYMKIGRVEIVTKEPNRYEGT